MPEPPATLFFFTDFLLFFGCAAFGRSEGFIMAGAGTGATMRATEVIRDGMKRPRARPMLGGAPAEAWPMLPALGFAAVAVALEG